MMKQKKIIVPILTLAVMLLMVGGVYAVFSSTQPEKSKAENVRDTTDQDYEKGLTEEQKAFNELINKQIYEETANNLEQYEQYGLTYTSVDGMERKDGSIGTLKIPSLNINMKVWEGETNTSMAKGLGHYSSTSGWDGNIGVCGHNRGAKYTIGSIKNLKDGDTITYTTVYGTRTYEVVTVETIASSDWSYLQATSDNRVTITTCLANQPSKRVCVQAVEVK